VVFGERGVSSEVCISEKDLRIIKLLLNMVVHLSRIAFKVEIAENKGGMH